jgi:pimeloyl-ACP methyl ester carboxylesterase
MFFKTFTITLAAASAVQAVALPRRSRESACSHYTIIDTRGNGTPQGPSVGFRTMNAAIRTQVPGGTTYNTVYPAGMDLNSAPGTDDIVRKIHNTLDDNPDECFVLEGYSLGATATTNALSELNGDSFHAVKAVFLIGNPEHRSGLACNVDSVGGRTTRNSNGILARQGGIPDDWISKTMDVCTLVS